MTRDAEMRASDWVNLVLRGIGVETDLFAVRSLVARTGQAIALYTAPDNRPAVADRWEAGLMELIRSAPPGSDQQLAFLRGLTRAAHSDTAVVFLAALLDGSQALEGLEVDTDLRWELLLGLARLGRADDKAVDLELDRDNTISGQESAAAARAAMPTAAAKARAWTDAVERDDVPNETMRSIAIEFTQPGQDDVLRPYLAKYLDVAERIWDERGVHHASTVLGYMFPTLLADQPTLETVDAWLESTAANPAARRLVSEGRDDIARALAAQARDSAG
jgi:aminopeptidase N